MAKPSRLARLTTVLLPIHPASPVFRNILVAILFCQLCSSGAPHAGLAVEDQLFVHRRLAEAEPVLEFVFGQEKRIRLRLDGDVDGAGNVPGLVLGGFADVCRLKVS